MAGQTNEKAMDNAVEVIERFGGIRPMSTKTNIPVTTIQGWKKRNTIPAARTAEIIKAAHEHDVDLSGLGGEEPMQQAAAPQTPEVEPIVSAPVATPDAVENVQPQDDERDAEPDPAPAFLGDKRAIKNDEQDFSAALASVEKKAVGKSAILTFVILAVVLGGAIWLLNQNFTVDTSSMQAVEKDLVQLEDQVGAVQTDVETVKEEQGFLRGMIPQDWEREMEKIREQASALQEQGAALQAKVGSALQKAEVISSDVLGEHAGDFEARLSALESHVQALGAQDALTDLMSKLRAMNTTDAGRAYLDDVTSELSSALSFVQDDATSPLDNSGENAQGMSEGAQIDINALLDRARQNSPALNETFANVPQDDMKAAAMLFAMNQFRGALNRDQVSFADDLKIMKSLIGEDNAELNAALDKLAPHAQSGILSVGGLSDEFRSLAGDAVVASLKGEDVSFQEKAKARMNEIFVVEKDGELVTGTDTQAKLVKAEKHLDQGELEAAVAQIETLSPEAQAPLQGWLQKAKVTMNARDAKKQLGIYVENGLNFVGGGEFINYPEYDMYILKPKSKLGLPDMGSMPEMPQAQ